MNQANPYLTCWCGSTEVAPFSEAYSQCTRCHTLINIIEQETAATLLHPVIGEGFYGQDYWFSYQETRPGHPTISERARLDLPERCVYWLQSLLAYKRPSARVLEVGGAHGGFMALLQWAGFEVTGLEISEAIVALARETFAVDMRQSTLTDFTANHERFDVIILMDVLEHLPDPVGGLNHCRKLLKPDGLLLLQTPCAPEAKNVAQLTETNDPFLQMLIPLEHLYLFNQVSLKRVCQQTGFEHLAFLPPLFAYDMFVAASPAPLKALVEPPETELQQSDSGRLILALLDLYQDRPARFAQIDELTLLLNKSEADRVAQIEELTLLLNESEADRAARLVQIEELSRLLAESEANRATRFTQIDELTLLLNESEADRAARLVQIEELSRLLAESEADRATRFTQIDELTLLLNESEADRTARLVQIEELSRLLAESEADRAARFAQIDELTLLLNESEADRAARFQQIQALTTMVHRLRDSDGSQDGKTK